jgi:hypothetical protein
MISVIQVRAGDILLPPWQQARFSKAKVKRMIREGGGLNESLLGVPELDLRDGKYYIRDGAHRHALILEVKGPNYLMSCMIHERASEQEAFEEAEKLNKGRLTFSRYHSFAGGLGLNRPKEVHISKILEQYGLKVGNKSKPGSVRGVEVLYSLYDVSPEHLERVIKIITSWSTEEAPQSTVLAGIGHALRWSEKQKYGIDDDRRLIRRLQTSGTPRMLQGKAGAASPHMPKPVANEIIKVWNKYVRDDERRIPLIP